jgi:hypothetical protein
MHTRSLNAKCWYFFSKVVVPVRHILLLFSIQQPTVVCWATLNFISTVTYSRPIVYENVCGMALPRYYYLLSIISLHFTYFHICCGTLHIGKRNDKRSAKIHVCMEYCAPLSTKNLPGVKGWLTTSLPSVSLLSRKCGSLDVSQPHGPLQPVTGIALTSKYSLSTRYFSLFK